MRLTEKENETLPIDVSDFILFSDFIYQKDFPNIFALPSTLLFFLFADCLTNVISICCDLLWYCPHCWRVQRHGCLFRVEKQVRLKAKCITLESLMLDLPRWCSLVACGLSQRGNMQHVTFNHRTFPHTTGQSVSSCSWVSTPTFSHSNLPSVSSSGWMECTESLVAYMQRRWFWTTLRMRLALFSLQHRMSRLSTHHSCTLETFFLVQW